MRNQVMTRQLTLAVSLAGTRLTLWQPPSYPLRTGLSVSDSRVKEIKSQYNNLIDFDKRPISYYQKKGKDPRGRFGRSKYRIQDTLVWTTWNGEIYISLCTQCSYHKLAIFDINFYNSPIYTVTVDASCQQALHPVHHQRVGWWKLHVFIKLVEHHPNAKRVVKDQKVTTISKYQLILAEYNKLRGCIFNSEKLQEETNLVLFSGNESSLKTWYKNSVRRDEVKILLQGISLPNPPLCAENELPSPMVPNPIPVIPHNPIVFREHEDTAGQANVRGSSVVHQEQAESIDLTRQVPSSTLS